MQRPIHIVTDTTCDIPQELLDSHHISVIPMYVTMGDQSVRDCEITPKAMFDYVKEKGELPRTSAFTMVDMIEHVTPYYQQGYDVLYIGISQKLSACHQIAHLAAQELPEGALTAFDTTHLSGSVGHLALTAAQMAEQGMSISQIVSALQDVANRTHTSFFVENVQYLYYGGRCNALALLGANALKLRPMILMANGELTAGDKLRGNAARCVDTYVSKIIPDWNAIVGPRIYLNYCGDCSAERQRFHELLAANRPDLQVVEQHACSIISCHCGPGTIGLLFETKE